MTDLHAAPAHPRLVDCESGKVVASQGNCRIQQVELQQTHQAAAGLDDADEGRLEQLVAVLHRPGDESKLELKFEFECQQVRIFQMQSLGILH